MTPYDRAREAFEAYAHLKPPALPDDPWSALQVQLARWQVQELGGTPKELIALGINEEFFEAFGAFTDMARAAGKISHCILKGQQKIRGFEDEERVRAAVGDGVADQTIFAIQLCTSQRLDYGTLIRETSAEILQRTWRNTNG